MQRNPQWLGSHVPALDGVRGLAIALVLLYHCAPRLQGLGLGGVAAWGWCGVDLFFVLSGFLITGIVLDGRGERRFFGNFYARRALRIWPVYALVVPVNFWLCGLANTWAAPTQAGGTLAGGPWWLYFALFAQNLTPGLVGTLYPAWSVAIEEQFYLVWAPLARMLPELGLGGLLAGTMAGTLWVRMHVHTLTPVNTLYHLDGLAAGGLVALAIRELDWQRWRWRRAAYAAATVGAAGVLWASRGHGAWLDTFFACGFAGVVLLAAGMRGAGQGAERWLERALTQPGLRFLGRISYSLYLTHVMVFALLGGVDVYLDRIHAGAAGDLAIVAMRFTAAIAVATALWYGFEGPILRLKRYLARPQTAPARVASFI